MARTIPLRITSEIEELTWGDVDWENNTILIHSPKTRKIGKSARLVPILPKFRQFLGQEFDEADGLGHVFSTLRRHSNPGVTAKKIVVKAKIEPWSNFFNALRRVQKRT
jgi:integrase